MRIPGLYDQTFSIETHLVTTLVKDALYYIHDVNSTSVSRGFREGGLEVCIDFEQMARSSSATSRPYWVTSTKRLQTETRSLPGVPLVPIAFHGALLVFDDREIKVTSNVQWDFNGVLADYIRNEYAADINREIEDQFRAMLIGKVGDRLSSQFNGAIQSVVQGARITGYHLVDGALVIDIETKLGLVGVVEGLGTASSSGAILPSRSRSSVFGG